ncbi:hypothetical protein Plhal304r1_c039g0116811 [Plasmopara halstedii]
MRIEGKLLFEPTTSNTKDLVDDDTVHPILSSKRNGRREPHIYLREAYDKEQAALILFKNAHVDKVKTDLFTSHEFQTWSKIIADAFPDDPKLGAGIMVNVMWRIGRSRLVDAISTAQVLNGKLAFGDHFIDALLLMSPINLQLRDGDSRTIGEHLEGELVVRYIGTQSLLYVIKLPNVQKWYFSLPKKEGKTAASILYHHLEEQRIKFDTIGDANLKAKGGAVEKIMKELVDYTLEKRVKELRLEKAIVGKSSRFDDWVTDAASLKANVATSVLPTLQKIFSKEKILLHCAVAKPSSEEAKTLVNEIQNAIKPSKT